MSIDTKDFKFGFWVGLGLILAFAAWHLLSHLLTRMGRRDG